MSIFTNKLTVTPNRIEMLIEFLKFTSKGYTRKQLQEQFSPNSEAVFNDVFKASEILNLIEIENDIVKLNINNKKTIYQTIQESVFNIESNEDNFLNILAWFLSLDKNHLPAWDDNVSTMIDKDLNGLINESLSAQAWQNFVYWIQYLGFSTQLVLGNKTCIIPDPTNALKISLFKIFQVNEEIKIFEFLSKVSEVYSVLELGVNRKYIYNHLREGLRLMDNQLSYSTSLAINRLERQGLIELISKADADVMSIESKRISHIKILGLKD